MQHNANDNVCFFHLQYNILADLYAGREIDSHLMYGHCSLDCLARQRRMPMIVAELLSYNADILCLQEVDLNIYESLLRPVFEAHGYQGFFSNKVSKLVVESFIG